MYKQIMEILRYPTREYREQRKLNYYLEEVEYLSKVSDSQLISDLISTKVEYERKKMITSFFTIGFILTIITNLWTIAFKLFYNYIIFSLSSGNITSIEKMEIVKISSEISGFLIIMLIGILLCIIMININETYRCYKRFLILEEYRKGRKRGS